MLFNLETDPCEHTDLAQAEPTRLRELGHAYKSLAATFRVAMSGMN